MFVSVIVDLFFTRRLTSAKAPLTTQDLIVCNRSVRGLLEGLVHEAAALETATLAGELRDLGGEWDAFATSWQRDWEETGGRCGFGDFEGTGKGTAYDRMAWVHRNLPTSKLKFRDLVAHFARDLGVEVAQMRAALDKSQEDLHSASGQGKRHE